MPKGKRTENTIHVGSYAIERTIHSVKVSLYRADQCTRQWCIAFRDDTMMYRFIIMLMQFQDKKLLLNWIMTMHFVTSTVPDAEAMENYIKEMYAVIERTKTLYGGKDEVTERQDEEILRNVQKDLELVDDIGNVEIPEAKELKKLQEQIKEGEEYVEKQTKHEEEKKRREEEEMNAIIDD